MFFDLLLAQEQARYATAGYEPDYHGAQFLGDADCALGAGPRGGSSITLRDLEPRTLSALEQFFTSRPRRSEFAVNRWRNTKPPSKKSDAPPQMKPRRCRVWSILVGSA